MKTVQRSEQDGLFLDSAEHWESWDGTIYVYETKGYHHANVFIPLDIIRHLNLKHKDKVKFAIRPL